MKRSSMMEKPPSPFKKGGAPVKEPGIKRDGEDPSHASEIRIVSVPPNLVRAGQEYLRRQREQTSLGHTPKIPVGKTAVMKVLRRFFVEV